MNGYEHLMCTKTSTFDYLAIENTDEAALRFYCRYGHVFLHIQRSEYGFDYTLYSRDFKNIDGGNLDVDEIETSTAEAAAIIVEMHGCDAEKVTFTNISWLLNKVYMKEEVKQNESV